MKPSRFNKTCWNYVYILLLSFLLCRENCRVLRHTEGSLWTIKRSYFWGKLPLRPQGLFLASNAQQKEQNEALGCFCSFALVPKVLQGPCLAVLSPAALRTSKPDAFLPVCLDPVAGRSLLSGMCKKQSVLARWGAGAGLGTVWHGQRGAAAPLLGHASCPCWGQSS